MTDQTTRNTTRVPADGHATDMVQSLYRALNGGGVRVVGRGARVAGAGAPSNGTHGTNGTKGTKGAGPAVRDVPEPRRRPPRSRARHEARRADHGDARVGARTGALPHPPAGALRQRSPTAPRTYPSPTPHDGARTTRPSPQSGAPGRHARAGTRTGRAARTTVTWQRALCAGLVCFAVWLVFDAPGLMRSAQSSPLGARRTVAIAVLRPIDDLSRALGISHVVQGADRALGRQKSGVLQVEGPPVRPRASSAGVRRPVPARTPFTPITAPDGLRPLAAPSATTPLQVLAVGDSLGIDFGQSLVNDLAATGVVHAVLDGHIDTGLSRPDYFDWQGELQTDLARYQPQAVVVCIGANDPQNFVDGGGAVAYGTQAWSDAYARRVGAFMEAAAVAGARVLWVGMPPMADPVLNGKMQTLNSIYQYEASTHRGVTYFASWPVLADPQGGYASFLPDASGSEVQVREPDGTHISPSGAERLSRSAIAAMDHAWGLAL